MSPRRARILLTVALLLGACSSSGGISSPCELTNAEVVESIFGGSVSEGVEGEARNCDFEVTGAEVLSVGVFHYGSASGWDSTREGFDENRSGVTDVEGIGDEAFYPNDAGPRELVVSAGGEIFSVAVFTGFADPSEAITDQVAELARAIAESLG